MPTLAKAVVFLSHVHEEAPVAEVLKHYIRSQFLGMVKVFVSSSAEDNPPGSRWLENIDTNLKQAKVILVLFCTKSSTASPWVNFEVGCSWMHKIPVVPIFSGSNLGIRDLPCRLPEFQGVDLESKGFAAKLVDALCQHLGIERPTDLKEREFEAELKAKLYSIQPPQASPTIIYSRISRTIAINEELSKLLDAREPSKETVWTSAFLSSFAIGEDDPYQEDEAAYLKALLKERELLLSLARRGCCIRCMISPANPHHVRDFGIEYAIKRTNRLIALLESNVDALNHIDWVVSELEMPNVYLVGGRCCFEGYKTKLRPGYSLTLRQDSPEVVQAKIELYKAYFAKLEESTLGKWSDQEDKKLGKREQLRSATIRCLRHSLNFLVNARSEKSHTGTVLLL